MGLSTVVRVAILVVTGLLIAVVGLAAYVLFPVLFRWQVEKSIVMSPSAKMYDFWKDIPLPIYIRFYFFNITNSIEVLGHLSKPIVEEVGPYTFREAREKVNITWNSNGTVSYRQIKRWHYQPDLTNGSLDDLITTLNVPMVTAAYEMRYELDFLKFTLSDLFRLTDSTIFVSRTARELLFEGYRDKLMEELRKLGTKGMPFDKFGYFYGRNNSDDGLYTMYTGEVSVEELGLMDNWNGTAFVRNWDYPCNEVNGSAGDMWPPFMDSRYDQRLTFFAPDVCRSLSLSYLKQKDNKGLTTSRFWGDRSLFDNGKIVPSHECFCSGECLPPGGLNVSSCKFGAPVVISYPHFLFADSFYGSGVIGVRPDPAKHVFYMDVEPILGIPVNIAARLQINIMLQKVDGIPQFENLTSRVVYPVLWFSEGTEIDEATAKQMRFLTKELSHIIMVFSFVLVSVGGMMLLFALGMAICYARRKERKYTEVTQESSD